MTRISEIALLAEADRRAAAYLDGVSSRRAFPSDNTLNALRGLYEPLSDLGRDELDTLKLLDELGSPATVGSNGARYFGFVIGATLPVAAAADRLLLSWDQCASTSTTSPACAALEEVAAGWLLELLDLPRDSAVGFSTGATAGTIACLSAARQKLLSGVGWDFENDGLAGSPEVKLIVSETSHTVVRKAARILGFGASRIIEAPVDGYGRVDPSRLPELDNRTILCLQAGEVNTGEFDLFNLIIPAARAAGTWVHIDGAFGLWARTSSRRILCEGVELADSWTTDGHKWLNTPYDSAVTICRDADLFSRAMKSDAVYAMSDNSAQRNLNLEFSRRARGIAIWAALRSLGRVGVGKMVDEHCQLANELARRLSNAGFEIINRVVLNQVLVRCSTDAETNFVRETAIASGKVWFGPTIWQGRAAFRISISSWRTSLEHIEQLSNELINALEQSKTVRSGNKHSNERLG
ncbi:MAG: pyridoxal-dependent decarboxylase [Aquidulcibacter sp.]|uniref:pyridoxal phosphate-dependent decarboxylase family protein n=1 Tax=Aquidulcibacter sp. TaxID=2052990 RepID=UPI0022BCE405|nr:pyridoxal-dependent decarboxylase [Aquidulcibacter sp.]